MTHEPKSYLSSYGDIEVVGDGDQLCARFTDFANLQASHSGFGHSDGEAIANLASELRGDHDAAIGTARELFDACQACLPDLEHYVSSHGPGPDVRLAKLKEVLALYEPSTGQLTAEKTPVANRE